MSTKERIIQDMLLGMQLGQIRSSDFYVKNYGVKKETLKSYRHTARKRFDSFQLGLGTGKSIGRIDGIQSTEKVAEDEIKMAFFYGISIGVSFTAIISSLIVWLS